MPHIAELRRRLDLSPNIRPNQVLTKAIRQIVPGGNALIEALTRVHQLVHSKPRPDPALLDVLQRLTAVRSAMEKQTLDLQ
jgi:hypothetical protein